MKKAEMIEEIIGIQARLNDIVARTYVKDGDRLLMESIIANKMPMPTGDNWKAIHVPEVKKLHTWMRRLSDEHIRRLDKVFSLLPRGTWETYAVFGDDFNDHREVKLLTAARAAVRKYIVAKNRPALFRKTRSSKGKV